MDMELTLITRQHLSTLHQSEAVNSPSTPAYKRHGQFTIHTGFQRSDQLAISADIK